MEEQKLMESQSAVTPEEAEVRNEIEDTIPEKPSLFRIRDEAFLFRLVFSAMIGVMAALVIVLAGMGSNRLSSVIVTRAFVGFFASCGFVFFVCSWLDACGIPMYVSKHTELQREWVSPSSDAENPLEESEDLSIDEMAGHTSTVQGEYAEKSF